MCYMLKLILIFFLLFFISLIINFYLNDLNEFFFTNNETFNDIYALFDIIVDWNAFKQKLF